MFGADRIGLQLQHLDSIVVSRYLKTIVQALVLVNSSPGFLYVPIISLFCSVIGFKLKLVSQSIILPTRKRNQNQPTLFPGSSLFLFPRGGGMKRTLGTKCIFPSEEEKRVRYFM